MQITIFSLFYIITKQFSFSSSSSYHHITSSSSSSSSDHLNAWVAESPMTFYNSFVIAFLSLAAICDSAKDRPVHSLMLSSHHLLCLPLLLVPGTVAFEYGLGKAVSLADMTMPPYLTPFDSRHTDLHKVQ